MDKLVFDYMNKDEVCTHVEVNLKTKDVYAQDFTKIKSRTVFAKRPHNIEELNKFLEERCFPRGRNDEKDILKHLGLTQYNPLDIVKITHGKMLHDNCWIRFEGETITWEEINNK